MKANICLTLMLLSPLATLAQNPASAFDRGSSLQNWQDPGLGAVLDQCQQRPQPFSIGGGQSADAAPAPPPPAPVLPESAAIPGVIAAGQRWEVVWAWQGNNADGPIAGDNGTMLFANNDASNVMQLNPDTGLATIIHDNTNTGGAVSRSKNGALFAAMRGLHAGVLQLEPQRRVFADSINGQPFDCAGGVVNDISADSKGGVYIAVSGGGLFYADSTGTVSQYGDSVAGANGIILNPDETVLYLTNGPVVVAFDVQPDGSLSGQRDFATLRGGNGDGSAVDAEGRLYVATGTSVDVFAQSGDFLGSIPAPTGTHGVAFGGADKRSLYGIVFYGAWGTVNARNQIVRIPLQAQGYLGRAK